MALSWSCFPIIIILSCILKVIPAAIGDPYTLVNRLQTECELEGLSVGSALADNFNSFAEDTSGLVRSNNDYFVSRLGFADFLQGGVKGDGLTPHGLDAKRIHGEGHWAGQTSLGNSSYWALENQWVYMMGDNNQKRIWSTFSSPIPKNTFDGNEANAMTENCVSQASNRNSSGNSSADEETCEKAGFGSEGKLTFDWKNSIYDDHDKLLLGENGVWGTNSTLKRPDILILELGPSSCQSAYVNSTGSFDVNILAKNALDVEYLFSNLSVAIRRHNASSGVPTMVIASTTAGTHLDVEGILDRCIWKFNRMVSLQAHNNGFSVFEKGELQRRILFKSENYLPTRNLEPTHDLGYPAPQILSTALLVHISCLKKKEDPSFIERRCASLNMTHVHHDGEYVQHTHVHKHSHTHYKNMGNFTHTRAEFAS